MKKIAFLGGGKIGKSMIEYAIENELAEVVFVYDPFLKDTDICGVPVIRQIMPDSFNGLDLVVECANDDVVAQFLEQVLENCDFLTYSMTAFRDDGLQEKARCTCAANSTTLYLPHGAILGLDGICDGRDAFTEVEIETIKNPASYGRNDTVRTVVFDGSTREATALYPRNVNVHAAVALAGIGFDRTKSRIISDPDVDTNSHVIHIKGDGIDFTINVCSYSGGAVSGKYVPLSACGSLKRVLGGGGFRFV